MSNELMADELVERLRELEERNLLLSSIIQGAADSIYAKDLQGRYISINQAGADYLNRSIEEVIGKTDVELMGDEGIHIMEFDAKLFKSGKNIHYENRYHLRDGMHYFSTNKSPLFDASGKMIGLIGVSRDITETKNTEEKYGFIFENSPISFWEEDFSAVKLHLDELKASGIRDLRTYFLQNQEALNACIDRIRVLNVNHRTLELNGVSDKNALTSSLIRNFTPESEVIFVEEFVALAEGKTEFEAQGSLVSGNGDILDVLFKLNVMPGHERNLSLVIISVIDVSENKKLVGELNSVRNRYQSILEAQKEMICRLDPNGRIIFKNLAFSQFFGFKDTAENGRFALLFPPDEIDKCNTAMAELSTREPTQTLELRNYDELGTLVWQQWLMTGFFSLSGTLLGFQAVGSDVTDRKMAQEALAASEARWRSVIDNADDIIMTVNSEGKIISANENRNRPRKLKWTGKTIAEIMPEENAREAIELLNEVFSTGNPVKSEFKIYSMDGSGLQTYGVSLSPIYFNTRVLTVICIARNITELKELEKQTKAALIEGQENERMRVSQELHDGLGQLFTAIKLNLQKIRSDFEKSNSVNLKDIELLETNVGVAFSEVKYISQNLMPDVLWKFGLGPAIEDLVNKWSSIEGLKIELEFVDLHHRYSQELEKALFRICQELLNNAIRHGQASQVFVQLIHHDDSLVLMVEDDGVGFDPNVIAKGFGMRNIRSRAEVFDGKVDIDSAPGRGTVATIEIPKFNLQTR